MHGNSNDQLIHVTSGGSRILKRGGGGGGGRGGGDTIMDVWLVGMFRRGANYLLCFIRIMYN